MINMKDLDGLEELLIEEIHKVVKTGEIKDATQVKAIGEVVDALKDISCIRNDNGMGMNGNDGGYSGYMPNMQYNQMDSSVGYNRNSDYGRRSPRMGRYNNMNGGYSGHSIHDRMIASLEDLYDNAGSQHEKTEIDNWIDRLRTE